MKRLAYLLLLLGCTVCISAPPAHAIDTTTPPPRLASSPILITAYYINGATPGYIELYNSSSEIVNLREYSLTLKWNASGNTTTAPLTVPLQASDGYLPSRQYAVVGFGSVVPNASIQFEALSGNSGTYVNEIGVSSPNVKPYIKTFTSAQTQRMMLGETSTGYTTTGTYSLDTRTALYDSGLYSPGAVDFPLAPIEVLANPRSCAPTETDTACREYIKFYNSTAQPISFDGTRLRIGYQGQAASSTNSVLLGGTVQPGEYAVFDRTESGAPITITNTGGYVWLEDVYGLVTYPTTVVEYTDASSTTRKGQSWAQVEGVWQWGVPNPVGANRALPTEQNIESSSAGLVPCRADQYRSPETNRCRSIETLIAQTPCDEGEYRNPDTGRCRKIASASGGSSLRPCDEGQYRNPETNRCKAIASQASSLVPCQDGWERNPETNRCRKAKSTIVPKADFAVESYQNPEKMGLGWVAFAVVGAGLASYAVWEWRQELGMVWRKLRHKSVQ